MCGFAGFIKWSGLSDGADQHIHQMINTISHRGPDDEGMWVDAQAGIALGFRRLAIVDLSASGHQPMISHCGRWIIAFNGEIYNYESLRRELGNDGVAGWRGHSDTEVLLEAIVRYGIEIALKKCVGMFAFALWDRETRSLTLARDRLGEKPLYYGWQDEDFLFASELAALYRHPAWKAEISRDALALLMRHNYVPAPYTIFCGISKLLPGNFAVFTSGSRIPVVTCYWDAALIAQDGQTSPFSGTPEHAVDRLEVLMRQSLSGQMMADVPLGAFLSGGVDSSTVVALMQSISSQPVRTFSIGFHELGYDEAKHAKAVASHLGTEHTELYVSAKNSIDIIPKLPTVYSEPFSDSSQIPTYIVSHLAKKDVTVSLSGDGGDELFSGYSRYAISQNLWSSISRIPRIARSGLASMIQSTNPNTWNKLLSFPIKALPQKYRLGTPGDKLYKLADIMNLQSQEDVYRRLISHWTNPEDLVLGASEPATMLTGLKKIPELKSAMHRMMYLDMVSYLPDDILAKVDRASMAVSLESRVPLLDHRIVEFAWSLPTEILRRDNQSKWPLRQILYKYVPRQLIERPKMGFGVPIDSWLRGPLRDWGEALLDETRLRSEGFFNADMVRQAWKEHQSNIRNWQYLLWDILAFQAWYENYRTAIYK